MTDNEIRKIKFAQINMPLPASEKLKTFSKNFKRGGKELKRGKIIESMAWQYGTIKENDRAIVWRNGQFEVIEINKGE